MILSNGQHVELKSLDSKVLFREEKIFHNQFRNSIKSTMSARNDSKFYIALDNEIASFNKWQDFVLEIERRKI